MIKIAWDDSYSVGVEEIDRQHEVFLRIGQRLQVMLQNGTPKEMILRIFLELSRYVAYHFVSEENLMIMVKYPQLEQHQIEHHKLLEMMTAQITSYKEGSVEFNDNLLSLLMRWFLSHTQSEDKPVGDYLKRLAQKR